MKTENSEKFTGIGIWKDDQEKLTNMKKKLGLSRSQTFHVIFSYVEKHPEIYPELYKFVKKEL